MKRVKQHDGSDCGAACLVSVCKWYSMPATIAMVRQIAGTASTGTTVLGLVRAAKELGFESKGVRCASENVANLILPAIAHLQLDDRQHFVVLGAVSASKVRIMDPVDGKRRVMRFDKFMDQSTGVFILMVPDDSQVVRQSGKSTPVRFWSLLRPHGSILAQCVLGAMVYSFLGLSTAVFIQKITDHVLPNGDRSILQVLGITMVVLLIFQIYLNYLKSVYILQTGQRIDAKLITGYYRHILCLPQLFFDRMKVGEVLSRVNDAVKIRIFLNDVAIGVFVNLITVVFSITLMCMYNWRLAALALCVLPVYAVIYAVTNRVNKSIQRDLMEKMADLEAVTVSSLQSARTIKALCIEDEMIRKMNGSFYGMLKSTYQSSKTDIVSHTGSEFVSRLVTILILWVGAGLVLDNQLSPGELFSFFSLTGYFTGPLTALIHVNRFMQDALIAADRLFEIMDLAIEENADASIEANCIGNVQLKNIHFEYLPGCKVLNGVNANIQIGRCTAIVGESGSGKSTILDIIQKRYLVSEGQLYIGNVSYQYISLQSLRKRIGVVPQHAELFAGTILENITIGIHQPDVTRVINILCKLKMMDFIDQLPNGLNSMVSNHGISLSGGQRQLLCFARMLYRDPEIVLMDEPTSSLDAHSDSVVQQVINEMLIAGKTVVYVTHRLAAIKNADQIYFIENGKVAESGDHNQLISNRSLYFQMWSRQNVLPVKT